ncbi:hypothetical protein WR25_23524 [Diploscapter pachys]|uniref:Uncharacterized protein n=1 Tax=Diploscapter pachys TaxID=2018661 RepID=A0A2A2KWA8_9BILA|nr:hypothetical protein WR25_23524 [Diploscapter pachys]
MLVAALLYAVFFVRETHFPKRDRLNQSTTIKSNNNDYDEKNPLLGGKRKHNGLMKYVSSYFEVITEKRPGYTRLCIYLSLFFAFTEFIASDNQLMMLLMKRPPFGWSDKVWTVFTLVKNGCYGFGMIALPLLLTLVSWLGKDSLMIILGAFSSAVCFFVISLATNTGEIFMSI